MQGNPILGSIFMYGAIFAIFYFILIRPQASQRKKHDELVRNLKKGDEIICPSLTWPSTSNMALALGAKVVFADVDRATRQIDPKDVAKRVTKKQQPRVPTRC